MVSCRLIVACYLCAVLKVREQNFILETFKCCVWHTKRMHSQSAWKVASFPGLHTCPVFKLLQYAKRRGKACSISSHEWHQCLPRRTQRGGVPDLNNELEALPWVHTAPALEFQTFVKQKMSLVQNENMCTKCILWSRTHPPLPRLPTCRYTLSL